MKHLKRFNESFDNLPDLTLEQKINTYVSFKGMSFWQKNVSAEVMVDDKFFEGKDYDEYTFDDFFEMDKFIGYKKSLFGTQGLEPGDPKRTSKSFNWYQKSHQTAIVRVMKPSKFNESSDFEYDTWEEIISSLDVYQLYELLQFKYGEVLTDTKQAIDEEEGDYNPDHIYEVIEYELKQKDLFTDFITNWKQYQIEKEEADPFHWRHRNKSYNDLLSKWGDMK
jgi:hypothetical protein